MAEFTIDVYTDIDIDIGTGIERDIEIDIEAPQKTWDAL